MMTIAFGQRSRVGKDTCAHILTSLLRLSNKYHAGVQRRSFAYELKMDCYKRFKHLGLREPEFYEDPTGACLRDVPLPRINKSPVQIWIEVGQKMREVYPDVWVDAVLFDGSARDALVISDLRFKNEEEAIHKANGICILVERPDAPPPKASDTQVGLVYDYVIDNDGTMADLYRKVEAIATKWNAL